MRRGGRRKSGRGRANAQEGSRRKGKRKKLEEESTRKGKRNKLEKKWI